MWECDHFLRMMVLEVRSLVGDVRGDLFFLMWRGDRCWKVRRCDRFLDRGGGGDLF